MGKVHRIKRKFAKLVAQEPWKTLKPNSFKYYGRFYVGVRWNGSHYIGHYGQSYNPLMNKLEEEYETGIGHTDKSPIRD